MANADKKAGTFTTNKQEKSLTDQQIEFVYKRVIAGKGINSKILKQEMAQTKLIENEIDNTYQKAILAEDNKKKEPAQMEEWSILIDHVKCYVM